MEKPPKESSIIKFPSQEQRDLRDKHIAMEEAEASALRYILKKRKDRFLALPEDYQHDFLASLARIHDSELVDEEVIERTLQDYESAAQAERPIGEVSGTIGTEEERNAAIERSREDVGRAALLLVSTSTPEEIAAANEAAEREASKRRHPSSRRKNPNPTKTPPLEDATPFEGAICRDRGDVAQGGSVIHADFGVRAVKRYRRAEEALENFKQDKQDTDE